MATRKAVIFAVCYAASPMWRTVNAWSNGEAMKQYLQSKGFDVTMYNDIETLTETSKTGMLDVLSALAAETNTNQLSEVVIHFIGHGSAYYGAMTGNQDSCLVPWDFDSSGVISKTELTNVLNTFNSSTRVLCLFDTCTTPVVDVSYTWDSNGIATIENPAVVLPGNVLVWYGDADSNDVQNTSPLGCFFEGSLTRDILDNVTTDSSLESNVSTLLTQITITSSGRLQQPKLMSSYNVSTTPMLFW